MYRIARGKPPLAVRIPAQRRAELQYFCPWNVYFGPLTLGRLHERHMRIEDGYGRLKCHKV
ncbi:MAG: hypothetical protein F9K13_13400 [Candidatus Methylomirabilis oxygeniifera]|nr:MAG: hypothetical protein F9K13_13400 [Candidatus Methylomirabilis oxyfera]